MLVICKGFLLQQAEEVKSRITSYLRSAWKMASKCHIFRWNRVEHGHISLLVFLWKNARIVESWDNCLGWNRSLSWLLRWFGLVKWKDYVSYLTHIQQWWTLVVYGRDWWMHGVRTIGYEKFWSVTRGRIGEQSREHVANLVNMEWVSVVVMTDYSWDF